MGQIQEPFTDAETEKKVSNVRENEYLIRPRPIFYSMFDEYYDLERFKMNDMNAIKLTNVLVEYMLFKNPMSSETYQSQDSQKTLVQNTKSLLLFNPSLILLLNIKILYLNREKNHKKY